MTAPHSSSVEDPTQTVLVNDPGALRVVYTETPEGTKLVTAALFNRGQSGSLVSKIKTVSRLLDSQFVRHRIEAVTVDETTGTWFFDFVAA